MLIVIANFCYTHKDIHVGCSQTSINIFVHNNELTQQRTFGNREPVTATGVVCGLGLKTRRGDGCRGERVKNATIVKCDQWIHCC